MSVAGRDGVGGRWGLGVDFGAKTTAAVLAAPDGRIEPVLVDDDESMPTVVFVASSGEMFAGRAALVAAFESRGRLLYDVKDRLGRVDGDGELAVAATAAVLGRIADAVRRRIGDAPLRVVIGCPTPWHRRRRRLLGRAAEVAGLPRPELTPEPVCVATDVGLGLPLGGTLVVYDAGDEHADVTLLRRTRRGFAAGERLAVPGSGRDLDMALQHVIDKRRPHHGPLLPEQLRRARERLSTGAAVTLGDAMVVTLREFNDAVAEPLREAAGGVADLLRRAGRDGTDLIVTGGVTRTPAVLAALAGEVGELRVPDDRHRWAVARGAARLASAGVAGSDQPVRLDGWLGIRRDRPASDRRAAHGPAAGSHHGGVDHDPPPAEGDADPITSGAPVPPSGSDAPGRPVGGKTVGSTTAGPPGPKASIVARTHRAVGRPWHAARRSPAVPVVAAATAVLAVLGVVGLPIRDSDIRPAGTGSAASVQAPLPTPQPSTLPSSAPSTVPPSVTPSASASASASGSAAPSGKPSPSRRRPDPPPRALPTITPSRLTVPGEFALVSAAGLCASPDEPRDRDAIAVRLRGCGADPGQRWRANRLDDGTYVLRNAATGKCLDLNTDPTTGGPAVQQWLCRDNDHQRWRITATADGRATMSVAVTGECLAAVPDGDGGRVHRDTCGAAAATQRWRLSP